MEEWVMAFNQEMVEQMGAWCLDSPELASERKKAWRLFFGEDDPRPVKYWTNADDPVSRERRFLGWFMFDYRLPSGERPAEIAARRLYDGDTRAEALGAVTGARYVFAVAKGGDRRRVYLDVEDESFEVRSPMWVGKLRPHQVVVAYLVPVRQGYWLPGPGWLVWPVSIGPGMRANLKAYQTDAVSMERGLQGRLDREERPEPPMPRDDTLEAAVARMSGWAREKGRPELVMSVEEWQTLVQKYIVKLDTVGLFQHVIGKLGGARSEEELQEVLALANNIWNNTPQPDRGGLSPNQLVKLYYARRDPAPKPREEATSRPRRGWHFDPDRGGRRIPEAVKRRTEQRIRRYAEQHFAGCYRSLDIRFRGQFCYVDAYVEPGEPPPNWPPPDWPETWKEMQERLRNTPTHLCRLRYFGDEERWSFAFYTYSNERYELSVFPSGEFFGRPEEAFEVSAEAYLR